MIEVGIIMGSDSDLIVMQSAADLLDVFGIKYELRIVSAHRTPQHMYKYAKDAKTRGLKIIIAGAGGAAHLPGMMASLTPLPVIGVPIKSSNSIDGWDSLLSIVQMPNGIPVATVAINAAQNAGILAVSILALNNVKLAKLFEIYRQNLQTSVLEKDKKLKSSIRNKKG